MQNLIWTIVIHRNDISSVTKFISVDEKKIIDIGSDHSQDIWIKEAFPQHVTLMTDSQTMKFELKAHKKLICEYQNNSRIITKNESHTISLSEPKTSIKIKIKNSTIECIIEHDTQTIEHFPNWKQKIEGKYGKMTKISEGHFTWVYNCGRYVIKILKPKYSSQPEYVAYFMHVANDLSNSSLEQVPTTENIILDDSLGLYAWVENYIQGTTLHDLVAQKKSIHNDMIVSIVESLTDFIRDLHLQNKIYAAINPGDIYIDKKQNIYIFGHYRSYLLTTNIYHSLPKILGFTHPTHITSKPTTETDIFLLGSLLYFLKTTQIPFTDIPQQKYLSLLKDNKLPELTNIPEKYTTLIQDALDSSIQEAKNFWSQFQQIEFNKKAYDITQEIKTSMETKDDYFGNFILKKKLGRGYLGTVYEAVRYKKPLIIKILNGSEKYVRSIVQDAHDASILEHNNILRVIEINKCGDTHYIAYEYISGQNLEQYIDQNEISIQKCLILVRDLARALQYAHVKGIVHRNIKPSNIIVDKHGQAYLVDFGLSTDLYMNKMFDKQLQKDFIYQSPSVLFGSLSPLHDVYSLGAVLYKLLTKSFITNRLYLPIWKKSNITREAEGICSKALAKQAKKRYQNASIFADDIDKLLQYKSIIAPLFNLSTDIQRRYRFTNYIIPILIGALFLIIAKAFYSPTGIYSTLSLKNIEQLQQEHEEHYLKNLQHLQNSFVGLSVENHYIQTKIYQQKIKQLQSEYKAVLQTKLLPISKQLYLQNTSKEHQEKLLEILENIIIFSTAKEENIYTQEYRKISKSKEKATKIHIENIKNCYIFKFQENQLGQNKLYPFDIKKQQIQPQVQQNLYAQITNLFNKTIQLVINKQHFEAQEQLIQLIEQNPNYINAYQLLCTSLYMSSLQKHKSATFQTWQKRAYQQIDQNSYITKDLRLSIKEKFSHQHIRQISYFCQNITSKQNTLLRIHSVIDRANRLQKNDLLYKVNGKYLQGKHHLYNTIRYKKFVSCLVIRNYANVSVKVPTSIFRSSSFYIEKDTPFSSLIEQGFLPTKQKILIKNKRNQVIDNYIHLPPGNYILDQNGHKKSFKIKQNVRENVYLIKNIKISLPPQLTEKYIPILHNHPNGQQNNTTGYLIGRHEVTIKDWKLFLYNTYREYGKNIVKENIPILSSGKPLFYMYKGEFTQIVGEDNWPIFAVSASQVQRYIRWQNNNIDSKWKKQGLVWRLPSDKEWEYAAQGNIKNKYVASNYNNTIFYNTAFTIEHLQKIHSVGTFTSDTSLFSIKDLGGNVKEYIKNHKNNRLGLKGNSWQDSFISPIDFTLYSIDTVPVESLGFRLCAGIDSFITKRNDEDTP
ncbi:protein kinase [Candidatus Uabimicrobium sp. HlEnr_7]|uniref:protein kinase domain-containing protein n=1 Tax=Candidatus Uabimicrobium helgolandensis TaxID=3095367 RepID=UPI0035570E15